MNTAILLKLLQIVSVDIVKAGFKAVGWGLDWGVILFNGKYWWIVGPMGAGKTSLHRHLAGKDFDPTVTTYNPTQGIARSQRGRNKLLGVATKPGKDVGGDPQFWGMWKGILDNRISRLVFICDPAECRPEREDCQATKDIVEALEAAVAALEHAYATPLFRPKAKKLIVFFNKADLWGPPVNQIDGDPLLVTNLRTRLAPIVAPLEAKHGIETVWGWGALRDDEFWRKRVKHVLDL